MCVIAHKTVNYLHVRCNLNLLRHFSFIAVGHITFLMAQTNNENR